MSFALYCVPDHSLRTYNNTGMGEGRLQVVFAISCKNNLSLIVCVAKLNVFKAKFAYQKVINQDNVYINTNFVLKHLFRQMILQRLKIYYFISVLTSLFCPCTFSLPASPLYSYKVIKVCCHFLLQVY